jgi:hypothetical protein
MLAVENAEIGGTLIALSIPGPKPLVDRVLSKLDGLHRGNPPTLLPAAPQPFSPQMPPRTLSRPTAETSCRTASLNDDPGAADNYRSGVGVDTTNMIHEVPMCTNPQNLWGGHWDLDFEIPKG